MSGIVCNISSSDICVSDGVDTVFTTVSIAGVVNVSEDVCGIYVSVCSANWFSLGVNVFVDVLVSSAIFSTSILGTVVTF